MFGSFYKQVQLPCTLPSFQNHDPDDGESSQTTNIPSVVGTLGASNLNARRDSTQLLIPALVHT